LQERQTKENIAAAEKKIAEAQAKAQSKSEAKASPAADENAGVKAAEDKAAVTEAAPTGTEEAVKEAGSAAVEGEN
jgi:hypothetical protein